MAATPSWADIGNYAKTVGKVKVGRVKKAAGPVVGQVSSTASKIAKVGKVGGALSAVGAGFDYYDRIQKGQSVPQAIAGSAAGVIGGTVGALGGGALGTLVGPGFGTVAGGIAGGYGGSQVASMAIDNLTGVKGNVRNPAGPGQALTGQLPPMPQLNQPQQPQQPRMSWNVSPEVALGGAVSAAGLGVAALTRGKVKPQQVQQAAQATAAAAPKAAKVLGGNWRELTKYAAPAVVGGVVVGEAIKQAVAVPILRATGIMPAAAPAPVAPARGAGMPGGMGRYDLPSQAAWWDTAFFGGKVNEALGNPGGLEYQKTQAKYGVGGQGDRTAGARLQGQTYTADQRLKGTDLQSGRQLEGTKYGADKRLQGQTYTADRRLEGVDLQSERQLRGQTYTADRRYQGTDLQSGRQLQGTKYTADARLKGVDLQSGRQLQGVDLTSGRRLEGTKYTADARLKGVDLQSGRQLQGVDLTSGRRLEGTKYTADARITQEGVRQGGNVAVADRRLLGTTYTADARIAQEGVKQGGQIRVAQVKGSAQMYSADAGANAKIRTAAVTKGNDAGYTTGTGVDSKAGLWSGGSRTDADRSGYNNVKAADFGNDATRLASNAAFHRDTSAMIGGQQKLMQTEAANASKNETARLAKLKFLLGG